MPLLSAEPTQFPEGLLADLQNQEALPGRWWAVYTRAKGEKALARHLQCRSVPHYLPLKHNSWRKQGRTFNSYVPLFPGYVFLFGDDEARVTALESNLVSRTLEVPDQARLWSDLRRVDRIIGEDIEIGRTDVLALGEPVEIVAGPFEGLLGVLIRRGNQMRLVVEVAFLHQTVSVEVEGWMVERVSRESRATLNF